MELSVLTRMVNTRASEYNASTRKSHTHLDNKAKNERDLDKVSCDHDIAKKKRKEAGEKN